MTLLSYTGILGLSSWLEDDFKCFKDLWFSIKALDFFSTVYSIIKVFWRVVDTCLIIGNFSACLIGLSGNILLAKRIFLTMRPISIYSFCALIGNQVIDAIWNRCLVKKISKQLKNSVGRQSNLTAMRHFALLLHPEWKQTACTDLAHSSKEKARARVWLHQLQYWDVNTFRDELKKLEKLSWDPLTEITEQDAQQLTKGLQKALHETEKMRSKNFELSILGYGALMVGRMYPDTAKQWGSISLISLLYVGLSFKRREINFQLARFIQLNKKVSVIG